MKRKGLILVKKKKCIKRLGEGSQRVKRRANENSDKVQIELQVCQSIKRERELEEDRVHLENNSSWSVIVFERATKKDFFEILFPMGQDIKHMGESVSLSSKKESLRKSSVLSFLKSVLEEYEMIKFRKREAIKCMNLSVEMVDFCIQARHIGCNKAENDWEKIWSRWVDGRKKS